MALTRVHRKKEVNGNIETWRRIESEESRLTSGFGQEFQGHTVVPFIEMRNTIQEILLCFVSVAGASGRGCLAVSLVLDILCLRFLLVIQEISSRRCMYNVLHL